MDFSSLLSALPDSVQGVVALAIIACAALSAVIRPPAAGSRWVIPYRVMNVIGLNVGWATNHLPGRTGTAGSTDKARDSPPH